MKRKTPTVRKFPDPRAKTLKLPGMELSKKAKALITVRRSKGSANPPALRSVFDAPRLLTPAPPVADVLTRETRKLLTPGFAKWYELSREDLSTMTPEESAWLCYYAGVCHQVEGAKP